MGVGYVYKEPTKSSRAHFERRVDFEKVPAPNAQGDENEWVMAGRSRAKFRMV